MDLKILYVSAARTGLEITLILIEKNYCQQQTISSKFLVFGVLKNDYAF